MHEAETIMVTSQGQVTLPDDWRKSHGLADGGECDALVLDTGTAAF